MRKYFIANPLQKNYIRELTSFTLLSRCNQKTQSEKNLFHLRRKFVMFFNKHIIFASLT